MIFRKLTKAEIIEIYQNRMPCDFAPGEIKPLSRILELWRMEKYFCYGLFTGKQGENPQTAAGYCFLVASNQRDAVLLDYFAVLDKERGKGCGSKCFSLLKKEIQKEKLGTLILEVENPRFGEDVQDISIRRRRIHFYRRNGMTLTHLRIFLYDVEYLVMTAKPQELFQSAEQIYHVYEVLLKPDKLKTKLRITANIRGIMLKEGIAGKNERIAQKLAKLEKLGVYVDCGEKLKQDLISGERENISEKPDINPEEWIVFGDSDSDAAVLERAGIGIVPENASFSAKNAANYLIEAHDDCKIRNVLEEILQILIECSLAPDSLTD